MKATRTISWFEIPTAELGRAVTFYQTMLGESLRPESSPGMEMAVFPYPEGHTGGALVRDPRRQPGASGALVYLVCDHRSGGLDGCLERARAAGAEIILPRTSIGPNGFIAIVRDSEGNLVGLHVEP